MQERVYSFASDITHVSAPVRLTGFNVLGGFFVCLFVFLGRSWCRSLKIGPDRTHPEDAVGNLGHPDISLPLAGESADFSSQPQYPVEDSMLGMNHGTLL